MGRSPRACIVKDLDARPNSCKYSYMIAAPAPAPSPKTPILPFPLPHSPALDRPAGMRGSRLPHDPETIAIVRLLYERTTLRHREIADRAGVSKTSVHGWALAGGWTRPAGAAKAPLLGTNGLPAPRLKGRMLAKRLRELAERYLDEMEKDFDTRDAGQCAVVLNFLKEAKLLEQPRKPRRPLAVRARGIAGALARPAREGAGADPRRARLGPEDDRGGPRGGGGAASSPRAEAGQGAPDSLQDPQGDGAEPASAGGDRAGAGDRRGVPRQAAAAANAVSVRPLASNRRGIPPSTGKPPSSPDPAASFRETELDAG
jgi:hypothetical protein